MSSKYVIVQISDAECVITLKRKGPKAVISYRDMMAIFTHNETPVYRGRNGIQVSEDVIDHFLNEGQHPYIEFENNKKLRVVMSGYEPVEIDFNRLKSGSHITAETIALTDMPTTTKLILLGWTVLIVGVPVFRLIFSY